MVKQKSKQVKRERINAVAQALFSEQGYHGNSMEMIIARAVVSKSLLFFHFQHEEQLLRTLQY